MSPTSPRRRGGREEGSTCSARARPVEKFSSTSYAARCRRERARVSVTVRTLRSAARRARRAGPSARRCDCGSLGRLSEQQQPRGGAAAYRAAPSLRGALASGGNARARLKRRSYPQLEVSSAGAGRARPRDALIARAERASPRGEEVFFFWGGPPQPPLRAAPHLGCATVVACDADALPHPVPTPARRGWWPNSRCSPAVASAGPAGRRGEQAMPDAARRREGVAGRPVGSRAGRGGPRAGPDDMG